MTDLCNIGLSTQSLGELNRQKNLITLNEIITDLESAVRDISNAQDQLTSLLAGQTQYALFNALTEQITQLQSSIYSLNNIVKGV